jgi:UDP-2,3-diacylglucosamine pyrophosphatase LpxH
LKEWNFDKKISARDMSILVAKAEKRVREDGKDTIFFHGGSQITKERIDQFKRRKTTKEIEPPLLSAGKLNGLRTRLECSLVRQKYPKTSLITHLLENRQSLRSQLRTFVNPRLSQTNVPHHQVRCLGMRLILHFT